MLIAKYVEEEEIDLIVMSTHGRRGLERILLGSVAEEVIRASQVPPGHDGPDALGTTDLT